MHEPTHVYGTTTLVRYSFQHFLNLFRLFIRARQIFGTLLPCTYGGTGRCMQAIGRNAPTVTEQAGPLQPGLDDGASDPAWPSNIMPRDKKKREQKKIHRITSPAGYSNTISIQLCAFVRSEFRVKPSKKTVACMNWWLWQMYILRLSNPGVHAWFLEKAQGRESICTLVPTLGRQNKS